MFTTPIKQVDDSQKMGTKRVELSACSPAHRPRSHTTPEKVLEVHVHTQCIPLGCLPIQLVLN